MTCPSKAGAIQAAIWRGYGKAAQKLGTDYQFYRPTPRNGPPWDDSWVYLTTLLFTRPVSLNAEDMNYRKPNKYGKATWYAVVDGTSLQVGDYFIGAMGTFFLAAMQPLLPILAVECNRIITIFRPAPQSGKGAQPYSGMTEANEQPIVVGVPCSILQGTKGEKSETALPGDTRSPWWTMLMPASVGKILMGDLITDDLGQRYIVSSNEGTDLGYRITAMMALN